MSSKLCSVEDCAAPSIARGLCRKHYYRLQRTGSTELRKREKKAVVECSVDGCSAVAIAKKLCGLHYQRFQRTGDPGPAQSLYQPRGGVCGVSGCQESVKNKGLCNTHYQRQLRGARLDAPVRRSREGVCIRPGCEKPIHQRGLCQAHARSLRLYGDFDHVLVITEGCSVDGCDSKHYSRGMCDLHYGRFMRTGDPIKRKRPPKGSITRAGYRVFWINGRNVMEHRTVMERMLDRPLLDSENVHHKNGKRDDNRPKNLELWVVSQPCGQRPRDLIAWAREIIDRYGDMVEVQHLPFV